MSFFTRFSLKNIGLIFIIIALIIGGGVYATTSMKMEQYPNVDVPYLSLNVVYPGATPSQVSEDVGKPIEEELSKLANLNNLYVISSANNANVMLEFSMTADMDKAASDVTEALAKVKLPDTAKAAPIQKLGPTSQPIYLFAVKGNGEAPDKVQSFIEDNIKPKLADIPDISDVTIYGITDKQVIIKIDPDKLKQNNLTLDKVNQAIQASNLSAPTGQVTINDKEMAVQVGKQLGSLDEIKNISIMSIQQNNKGMTDAFSSIGNGFKQIGGTIGTLGKSVGMTSKQAELLQQEILVTTGISQLAGQLQADQMKLQSLMSNTSASQGNGGQGAGQGGSTQGTAQEAQALKLKIQAEQNKLTELQGALKKLQAGIDSISKSNAQNLSSMSKGNNSGAINSAPSTSTSSAVTINTVKLSDIATVTYEAGEQANITRLNGKPATVVAIQPNLGSNTVEIVKNVKAKLKEVSLPKGYEISTLRDESVSIYNSVQSMLREALFGALLAAVVTLLFLRNLRTTIIALLSIPLSIFVTMFIMKQMDYSLNMMTLAGIAVAVGRVVDDSIVVIENLYRRILTSGKEVRNAEFVLSATKEVSSAITSSTVTTIGVFIPLAFVPGIVGKFFAPFAWSVVISIAFSLVIAVTVIPVLSKLFLLNLKPVEHRETVIQKTYKKVLDWSLHHKTIVLVFSVLLLLTSILGVKKVPINFFPQEKSSYYNVSTDMPVGTSLDKANSIAAQVEKVLADTNEVANYQTTVTAGHSAIQVTLKENADTKKFEDTVRKSTNDFGKDFITTLKATGNTPGGGGLSMIITGSNVNSLNKAATKYEEAIKNIPGLAEVTSNVKAVRPQISVKVDNDKAVQNGIYQGMIASTVRNMISGSTVSKVVLNNKTTDINVQLDTGKLDSLQKIADQKITNSIGDDVSLKDIATVEETTGPTSIQRLNKMEYVSINGKFTSNNSAQIQKLIQQKVSTVKVPKGVSYYFEGEAKSISEGFTNMFLAIGVSIILVYLVMIVTFSEMLAPFAILFSLPFVFVGVIFGLLLTHESLGMPALVGILMLIGIVVTNAIVLVDKVKQNETAGMNTFDALIEAGTIRIRPILMTAVATVGALTPLALSTEGGLISRSLAIVVISGLTTSTLLTLVIVPVVYSILDKIRGKLFKRKAVVEA
ncbi:efflux RND transporter permease subunit [Neobacillus ginsengisoli]|uniref:HAE1 family hydrophobic/amphiphilic exporter-1 n=1 Tax=Neobacillus ginsengisoli TaxID=904295 RepID=A0ABT9XZ46_9BACI|nr:efflux RND transporter permease subunit [Neobacillus ginsengisoli]MDQ0200653.1 HAE1 family hydrophobic/amphiphilic exporter-1 [Neobacillus ginsengisoli]